MSNDGKWKVDSNRLTEREMEFVSAVTQGEQQ